MSIIKRIKRFFKKDTGLYLDPDKFDSRIKWNNDYKLDYGRLYLTWVKEDLQRKYTYDEIEEIQELFSKVIDGLVSSHWTIRRYTDEERTNLYIIFSTQADYNLIRLLYL